MERKGFIGGSDCTKIMEGYWLELWNVKTGREESENLQLNLPVQLGVYTETFNLNWFTLNEGKQVVAQQREFTGTVGNVPVKGTIDGAIQGERNIIEAKHTNNFYNMDKMLDRYMPQLQFYCHMAKAEGVYLSVIFGNSNWECIHVKYDEEYFNSMWAVVSDFWGYVVRDEQPVGVETEKLSRLSIALDDMETRDASLTTASLMQQSPTFMAMNKTKSSRMLRKTSSKWSVITNEKFIATNSPSSVTSADILE